MHKETSKKRLAMTEGDVITNVSEAVSQKLADNQVLRKDLGSA